MTRIQEAILHIITGSKGHMTADQVFALVRQTHPTASLSTVYRNLNAFADAKKIRRIQRATGADYFERNLLPHDHAYCVKCGKVSDFMVPELKGFLAMNFEYPIISFELLVNYRCPECAKEESESNLIKEKGESR